jgi:hypothetical protein
MDVTSFDVVRALQPSPIVRAASGDAGGAGTLAGHFSVFDTWYEINSAWEGNFLERTVRGAFAQTIAEDRDAMRVTFNHGYDVLGDQILGVVEDLREDKTGAAYEVGLFDSVPALLLDGLRAGQYGSSFRFRVREDSWLMEPPVSDHNPKGLPERTLLNVRTSEFGPVTFGANPGATAGVRSMTDEYYERLRARDPGAFAAADQVRQTSIGRPAALRAGGDGHGKPASSAGDPSSDPTVLARTRALLLQGVLKP